MIVVSAPFSPAFRDAARSLSGRWDATSKTWEFDAAAEETVRQALLDTYGTDGTPAETVTLRMVVRQMARGEARNEITVGGVVVARRWSRDEAVKMQNGARVISGAFAAKGKSASYPGTATAGDEPVMIEVSGLLRAAVQESADVRIVAADGMSAGPVRVTRMGDTQTKECLSCGAHVTRREVQARRGDWNAHGTYCECGC